MRQEQFTDRLQDWLPILLRWLSIFGLTVGLALREALTSQALALLLLLVLWNASLTLLVALDRRLPVFPFLSVAGDLIFACLLFGLAGGLSGVAWVGILPIMSASVYFSLAGGLTAAGFCLVIQGLVAVQTDGTEAAIALIGTLLPLYLLVAVLFGLFSGRIQHLLARGRSSKPRLRASSPTDGEDGLGLYPLISALSASLNYQRVLENALDLSTGALGGPESSQNRIVSAFLLFNRSETGGTELGIGSARRFTPADMRVVLSGTSGLLARAIEEGTPQLSTELAGDPELSSIIALRACQSVYCLPLHSGLDTYGVLVFSHPDADFFNSRRREVLNIIANQAAIAIQNALLYRDLEQEKERIMQIQEEARNKLARDLHDGPTQTVAAIAMRVNFARRLVERDPKAAASELFKVEELARRTTKEIRHMLFTLRPLVLESQGLVPALESMAEKMEELYGQEVVVAADPDVVSQLELGKQGVIFYIVEEAVNNARKHAQAAHVWVRLSQTGQDLAMLEVEDDGVGFELDVVDTGYENRGSMGLLNLKERTELLNGYLKIDSQPGNGTRVSVLIPLTDQAAERVRRGQ